MRDENVSDYIYDELQEMLKVWSTCRNICKEFLDCEGYAILFNLFGSKLIHPALPKLLDCAYKYLMLSSHCPLVDLKEMFRYTANVISKKTFFNVNKK
jgi:hypothetical protein